MRTFNIRWIGLVIAGALAAVVVWVLSRPVPVAVDTAMVTTGPIAATVSDQGTARVRQSYVVAAPVAGRIERLPVEVGDPVVARVTVVARILPAAAEFLDPRARRQAEAAVDAGRSALTAAVAQRDRAAADVTRTERALQRTRDLAAQGLATAQDLDNVTAEATAAGQALRAADADIATRRANLQSAEALLAGPLGRSAQAVTVTSPTSGVVTRLLQQSERTVAVGTQLVEVGDTRGLEAAIEFLSQDAVKISVGQRAEIYNWGGEANLPARVRRIEPQAFTKVSALGVEEQRTLVYLQFECAPDEWAHLAPGYRVWGRVFLRELSSASLVPVGALVRESGRWAAYRVDHDVARLTALDIGIMTDESVELRSGLSVGDQVVVYPSDQVRDGTVVTVRH